MLEGMQWRLALELVTFAHEVVQGDLCDALAVEAPHKLQQLEEQPHAFSLFWTATLHILTCKPMGFMTCLHEGCGKTGSTSVYSARRFCSGHVMLGRRCVGVQELHTAVLTGQESLLKRAVGDHRDAEVFAVL